MVGSKKLRMDAMLELVDDVLRCARENNEATQFHERWHRENVARLEASNHRNGQPPKLLAA